MYYPGEIKTPGLELMLVLVRVVYFAALVLITAGAGMVAGLPPVVSGTIGGFDALAYLEERLGRPLDRAETARRHKARHLELTAARSVYPGVLEIIEAAEKTGLLLGVASSSSRGWVTGHLGRLGLLPRFHAVKCRDDVEKVKPDPELYLAVMRDLKVKPAEAIAFEDSLPGIEAAKAAGIFCVAVPSELTKGFDFGRADLRLDSLAGVELAWLLARANGEAA